MQDSRTTRCGLHPRLSGLLGDLLLPCSFPALPYLALKAYTQLQRVDEAGTELLVLAADPEASIDLCLAAVDTVMGFAALPCLDAVKSAATILQVTYKAEYTPCLVWQDSCLFSRRHALLHA